MNNEEIIAQAKLFRYHVEASRKNNEKIIAQAKLFRYHVEASRKNKDLINEKELSLLINEIRELSQSINQLRAQTIERGIPIDDETMEALRKVIGG